MRALLAKTVVGALAAVALAVPLTPTAAGAATYKSVVTSGGSLYWCPGNASLCQADRRIAPLFVGTTLRMECWLDVPSRSGSALPRWFFVTISNGVTGWVKAERVSAATQTTVAHCDRKPAVKASLWTTGVEQYGKVNPTATAKASMQKHYSFTDWGTYGDWSGDCVSFSKLAWLANGTNYKLVGGNAIDMWNTYKSMGKAKTTGTPPRGALVFWNASRFGHVAVSLGNGRVVTTQGLDNGRQVVTDTAVPGGFPNYLGWVMPY